MKRPSVLDSFALLTYLEKESDYQKVKDIFAAVQRGQATVFMNEINIGEVYYILARERSPDGAEYFLNDILPALGITAVANALADVIDAAKLKAQFPIAYADAFAVTTALKYDATLVTGDPDFKHVERMVDIQWLV